jgi:hypothetical protein
MISLRSIIEQSTSNFEYLSDKIFEVHRVNDLKIKNESNRLDYLIIGFYHSIQITEVFTVLRGIVFFHFINFLLPTVTQEKLESFFRRSM